MEISKRDIEKLNYVLRAIEKGTATSFDKIGCKEALLSIISPTCSICRKPIKDTIIIVNERKMHPNCRSKYKR